MIPCLEPVLITIAWFSWCNIDLEQSVIRPSNTRGNTYRHKGLLHVDNSETLFGQKTRLRGQPAYPNRFTSKMLRQLSSSAHDLLSGPIAALFSSTAT